MRKTRTLELAGALGHVPADKRVEILRRVGQVGSISQAAREAGVSYKAAWQALDTLSNLAGAALVERAVGGAGGGGARLTPAGEQLLRAADELARARDQVLARLAGGTALAALGLRTSMRNQLPCIVEEVRPHQGALLVRLMLPGGQPVVARITKESGQLLGLQPGQSVLALCKAAAVDVRAHAKAQDARNPLAGRVTRSAGGEVALALEGGLSVVGFGEGLRRGQEAVAWVDPSAVVIALS
jgi:molybdate transport system regulatory protein